MFNFMRIARPLGANSDDAQQQQHDIERQQQQLSALTAFTAFEQATALPTANANANAAAAATAPRVSRRVRLERDSNATLFGPSLANYFPLSTTAAVAAANSTPAVAATATATATDTHTASPEINTTDHPAAHNNNASANPPAFAPLTTVSSINSATLRRPRLGASGRARGASLSNLSVPTLTTPANQTPNVGLLDSPSVGSPHQVETLAAGDSTPAPYNTRPTFPGHRRQYTTESAWSVPGQDRADNDDDDEDIEYDRQDRQVSGQDCGPLSLADAIQIGTLHRWLQRAAGGGGATLHPNSIPQPAADPTSTPTTPSPNEGIIVDASGQESIPLTNLGPSSISISPGALSVCTILQSYVNLKRNTFRLTLGPAATRSPDAGSGALPTLPPHVLAPAPSAPILAHPTHILHFEYDCAAPRCAVHVFVRASRKHGSWNQATSNPDFASRFANAVGSQTGTLSPMAPPHILGFPILAATTIASRASGQSGQAVMTSTSVPSDSHHLPLGFAQKRSVALRLDMSLYAPPSFKASDTKTDERAQEREREAGSVATPVDVAAEVTALSARAEEDKEKAKVDKTKAKAEKETLKVTIVVEALDENGKPLAEPNLQTTYLRLTSVPAPTGSAAAVIGSDGKMRVWSAQVEAQEAEIGPHRFQLQELFGLSTRPPPASLAPADPTTGDTAVTEGAGGAEPGEGEGEGNTEIPTEVPAAGSTPNLNDSTDALGVPRRSPTSGAPGTGPTPTSTAAYMPPLDSGTTGSECLICLTSPPSTLLLPCTHGLCLECAVQLRESVKNARDAERRRGKNPRRKYACPVCRRAYTSMLHLSTADEKHVAQASAHGVV
ncbi:unnamed protein product [Tilletia controversa]|uniref:RING-type domain-containing protein n=1 Tax=Tilletia controversa TaxID=13291 RepID=A0A8X7MUW1_9BASI|nr:hypothetical protein CF328_g646 [Tilletia controversa]KAE8249474.1 hypothetical protein A4X06_0g3213 [Tilletia controversa]CAD6902142.1 unnamed protein product [Tilletia controversa]CAD6959841.1 unnamed protein product [Tilletia controversa]CAD6961209.1 unnamed protein product [Tilletia controversa]